MALIKCPECGKEYSDKAPSCPNCGCPTNAESTSTSTQVPEKTKKSPKGIIIGIICAVVIVGGIFGYKLYSDNKKQKTYVDAQTLISAGNYDEGIKMLEGIKGYSGVDEAIEKALQSKEQSSIDEAVKLAEEGKYDKAEELLNSLEGSDAVSEALDEVEDMKASEKYESGISLLNTGKYDEGIAELKEVIDYKDAAEVIEQAKYESYGFSAVKATKKVLKNPDSMLVHEITFYGSSDGESSAEAMTEGALDETNGTETEKEVTSETEVAEGAERFPSIVIHYGAQNGFGGTTTGYSLCSYDEEEGEYTLEGITNELDEEELDKDDDNYYIYAMTAMLINALQEGGHEVGSINRERFDNVIKSSAYTAIKLID